jgi:DNA-binding MarR family transcriptional regulator
MLTGTQREELSYRILSILIELDQGVKASALTEHLQVAQRDVVGRLQALKRRGMVVFVRDATEPYAAGHWNISEQGRQAIDQMAPSPVKADATGTDSM